MNFFAFFLSSGSDKPKEFMKIKHLTRKITLVVSKWFNYVIGGKIRNCQPSSLYGFFWGLGRENNLHERYTERSFTLAVSKIIKSDRIRIDGKQVKGIFNGSL